jgi:hypothetical protein
MVSRLETKTKLAKEKINVEFRSTLEHGALYYSRSLGFIATHVGAIH